MRRLTWFVTLALLVFLTCPTASAELRVGAAIRNVTPDPLLPVSGGTGGSEPATKKQGELTVRALVLENGDTRVAIVGTDFLGFPAILGDRARAKIKDIPPHNVIIGATHAHSAPDMYAFTDENGKTGADLKYIDAVCGKVAEAVNEALANREPASFKVNTAEAKGKIAFNYYAPELYDHRMNVMQFVAKDGDNKGKPIATLVNYATHPEVIGSDQGILSPDLCGPLYDRVAEQGGGVGVFMNSAQGGMVTADCRNPDGQGKDVQTWEECIRIGQLMADEALRIVKDAPAIDDPPLACFAKTFNFSLESPLMKQILSGSPLKFQTNPDGSVSSQVNVVNLGPAQILTIPGEALPNIGFYLKRKMHGKYNCLFGLTNDAFGYMLTKVDWNSFERYDYISKTSLSENAGDEYIAQALAFVDACPKP